MNNAKYFIRLGHAARQFLSVFGNTEKDSPTTIKRHKYFTMNLGNREIKTSSILGHRQLNVIFCNVLSFKGKSFCLSKPSQ